MKKFTQNRGIAQLVEYRSPKPWVVGSSPSAPAKKKRMVSDHPFLFAYGHMVERTLGEQSEPRRRLLANSRRVLPRQARQGSEPFVFLWSIDHPFLFAYGHMVARTLGEQGEPRRRLLAISRRVLPRQARQGSEPFSQIF